MGLLMNELLKNTFNNESEIYDSTTQYLLLDYNVFLGRVVEKIGKAPNDSFSILDLGCGTGNLTKLLRETYPNATIYALDYSSAMLKKAREKNIANVDFIQCDMFQMMDEHLPLFDFIVSSYVFHNFNSVNEHQAIYKLINEHLSIKGRLILLDLIDLCDIDKKKNYESRLTMEMRRHHLSDEEIIKWMGILKVEDAPLSVELTASLLSENNFENITINPFDSCGSAIFVAEKKIDEYELKAELLFSGLHENETVKQIYKIQNPNEVWKTGNNGIFLTIMGQDTLLSINHKANKESPYEIIKIKSGYSLLKRGEEVTTSIKVMSVPDWYTTEINNNKFSNYFVLEGNHFLHLAYKGCAFSKREKCKFCSTKRRNEGTDNAPDEIINAFKAVHKKIGEGMEICLGGGTYIPFSENVQYFLRIIEGIRGIDDAIPIWVECIPPAIDEIDKLIDAGATSFGFNIEIWSQKIRDKICPGKSQIPREHYLNAMKHVVKRLGKNRVGSCIIVGLDSYDSIKNAIDELINVGVEPCILPYKKYNRTNLGGFTIDKGYQHDFIRLSRYAAIEAYKHGIIFNKNQGCLNCVCCTIMHDIQLKINQGVNL